MNRLICRPERFSRSIPLASLTGSRETSSPPSVVTSSRRSLLAPFGYQRNLVGAQTFGYVEHLLGERHLEIEDRSHLAGQTDHIFVLYMPAVLAQVRGDPLGARVLAERCRGYRIRFIGAPRLAQRRHMIDVDIETLVGCWHSRSKLGSHPITLGVTT
jgi:hypothetical protein